MTERERFEVMWQPMGCRSYSPWAAQRAGNCARHLGLLSNAGVDAGWGAGPSPLEQAARAAAMRPPGLRLLPFDQPGASSPGLCITDHDEDNNQFCRAHHLPRGALILRQQTCFEPPAAILFSILSGAVRACGPARARVCVRAYAPVCVFECGWSLCRIVICVRHTALVMS